jgi:exosortase
VLEFLGYPIDRQGIVIFIAQYRLLVEDACSGMNSLIGLVAVMLFYIYIIHRASLRYTALLGAAILPIAVLVNLVRVMALILLTYYAGDEVAQGFLHVTTGVVLFAAALALTLLLDKALHTFILEKRRPRPDAGHA